MKKSCKALAWSVLSCGALCGATAHATPISLSFSGTIQYGVDYAGEFGVRNTDLSGRAVEVRYSFDSTRFGTNWSGTDLGATQTVTVGGVSKQYTLDPGSSWSESYLSNALSLYGNYDYYYGWYWYNNHDQVFQNMSGYFAGGGYVDSYQSVYSYTNPINPPTDGNASWSYQTQADDDHYGYFSKYDAHWTQTAYFSNSIDRVSLNAVPVPAAAQQRTSDVPEPATLALTCLALLAVFGTRRALQLQLPRALPPA